MQVYWRIDATTDYVLREITPAGMLYMRRNAPDLLGLPQYWARMADGDVEWFPDCMQGQPRVVLSPQETAQQRWIEQELRRQRRARGE